MPTIWPPTARPRLEAVEKWVNENDNSVKQCETESRTDLRRVIDRVQFGSKDVPLSSTRIVRVQREILERRMIAQGGYIDATGKDSASEMSIKDSATARVSANADVSVSERTSVKDSKDACASVCEADMSKCSLCWLLSQQGRQPCGECTAVHDSTTPKRKPVMGRGSDWVEQQISTNLFAVDNRGRTEWVLSRDRPRPPQSELPTYDRALVSENPALLMTGWCPQPLGRCHPSLRFLMPIAEVQRLPDPVVMVPVKTAHIPLLHYHVAQIARAEAVGASFESAEGPSPHGGSQPQSWSDIFIDPQTWEKRRSHHTAYLKEIAQCERNGHFRMSAVPGGRDGYFHAMTARKPQFRRQIWRNVDGFPQEVVPCLPDPYTDFKLVQWYRLAIKHGVSDMEIVSQTVLYGLSSFNTSPPNTRIFINYGGGWKDLKFIDENRRKQYTDYDSPRLLPPSTEPCFEPELVHPKSVHRQVKADGSIKKREITDFGAERERVHPNAGGNSFILIKEASDLKESRRMRHRMHSEQSIATSIKQQLRRKGRSGRNSYNVGVASERLLDIDYAAFDAFLVALDILASSGVAVDIIVDDFRAWYPQWPMANTEHHLNSQIICSAGLEVNPRPNFGAKHFPERTNRGNFASCEILSDRLYAKQREIVWTPWAPAVRTAVENFIQIRRSAGASGHIFTQFGWFDDNSLGCLSPFTSLAKSTRYEFWREINWEWEKDKAATNLYGAEKVNAIVGFDIFVAPRKTKLPPVKVDKYSCKIDEVISQAEAHPRALVRNEGLFDTMIGQLVHSSEVIPDLWQSFIELMTIIRDCRGPVYTRCPPAARRVLKQIIKCVKDNPGIPLTPYSRRPGYDKLPVWVSYTDATRNTRTFFGAQGGYLWHWGHGVVFFFARQWERRAVQRSNIGEMEMAASNTAASFQEELMGSLFGQHDVFHYLFQYGDNSAVFDYTLNNLSSNRDGMRRLCVNRVSDERRVKRLLSACHVPRTHNTWADALANMDITLFAHLVWSQWPHVVLCRLVVSDAAMWLP